jgi:hypothetical protein
MILAEQLELQGWLGSPLRAHLALQSRAPASPKQGGDFPFAIQGLRRYDRSVKTFE